MTIKELVLNQFKESDLTKTVEINEFTIDEIIKASFNIDSLVKFIIESGSQENLPDNIIKELTNFQLGLNHIIDENLDPRLKKQSNES